MKSSKFWKIIWLLGIYANLLIILYLVIRYKVEWEHKDLNTYLYFYDCGQQICTANVSVDNYYNKIICDNGKCPYVEMFIGSNVILKNNSKSFLYNYINGKMISDIYIDYRYIGNNLYTVKDKNGKYGVIDNYGEIVANLEYNYINDYQNGFISYVENNLYGIMSTDDKYNILPKYEDVVLINEKKYAAKMDNLYQIYSYDSDTSVNGINYNYVFADNNIIFVISDSKIDVLDSNLKSILLMKIDTYYKYTIEQERDSLDFYSDGEYIYFKVFINDTEYNKYKYSINENRLISG